MEGIGNTPANFVKRIERLAADLKGITSASDRDRQKLKSKLKGLNENVNDIAEHGVTKGNVFGMLKNTPILMRSDTAHSLSRASNSAINLGLSVNELGQTSASIVGTQRSNSSYDGQDLETGIRFALMAKKYISHGVNLPTNIVEGAKDFACTGGITVAYAGDRLKTRAELTKDIGKEMLKGRTRKNVSLER